MNSWPKISIITPSFNQVQFIEETICSVLQQGYPNLEYFVMDGGSTDGSVKIIQKYSPSLTYWQSTKDKGQSDAINQGLRIATGEIIAWINSDDTYLPDTLHRVANYFRENPDTHLLFGNATFVNEQGKALEPYLGAPFAHNFRRFEYWKGWNIPQPTLFFRREVYEKFGGLDETYHFALDYEWIIRISSQYCLTYLDEFLATYRIHTLSKTGDWEHSKPKFHRECLRANKKYAPLSQPKNFPIWVAWIFYLIKSNTKKLLRYLAGE